MAPAALRFALRTALRQVRHVPVVRPRAATGLVRSVYRQVEGDFGMLAPPVALHSAQPQVLAAAWTMLRETLVARTAVDRTTKEAVAAAVSLRNTCPYCVEVHGAALQHATGSGVDPAGGVVGDERLRAIGSWVRGAAPAPPLDDAERAELLGVALTFDYLNRVVNVFLPDSPLPSGIPGSARERARAALSNLMLPGGRPPAAGRALSLLPRAPLPDDLAWARPAGGTADAVARASAAIEAAAAGMSDAARTSVRTAVADWDGRAPGISRGWVEPLLPESAEDRAVARLLLLTALSSSQVDEQVATEFPGGARELIAWIAWAALLAARRQIALIDGGAGWKKTEAPREAKN
ncbi:carboxymuconolactone decarboxylase family protein [Saccharopolyspora indica]|uniref:carboxymuconolactone decarboxylase family protein n=1 Tax=Saccharopolyspora indica TaxID=1229659 RepID=UPI0022EA9F7B|nr:carboxymuconolactone decarboxylase family protein [Saccharopolyspora indica]MDA3646994.1 carboxymuconolactone decarboxylase family protein [Saccharopolyspora indica]